MIPVLKELLVLKVKDRHVKLQFQLSVMGAMMEICCKLSGGIKELSDQASLRRRATEGSLRKILTLHFKGELEICPLDTATRNFSGRRKSMCQCTGGSNNWKQFDGIGA